MCPVFLRIFWKGRKDRQTGIYIPKSQWLVKEQCVKPTHPQAGTLNLRLQEIKNAVIQRRNLLVAKGLDYTIDDLLSENGRDNGRASEVLSYGSSLSSIPYTIPRSQVPFSILLYPSYCFIQRYYILLIFRLFLERKRTRQKERVGNASQRHRLFFNMRCISKKKKRNQWRPVVSRLPSDG